MSEAITENLVEKENMSTITGVTTIMGYINGLMVGSVPQEFYDLLVDVYGSDNVNRMIALGGVKYVKAIMNTARTRAEKEERDIRSILEEERGSVVFILNTIYGGEDASIAH